MSKLQNPLTLARAIVSAHKRWIKSPAGGTLQEGLVKALAREGRRNVAEAAQVIKSALGRCTASDVVVKSESFTADCMESVQSEQVSLFKRALRVLEPVVQVPLCQILGLAVETGNMSDSEAQEAQTALNASDAMRATIEAQADLSAAVAETIAQVKAA